MRRGGCATHSTDMAHVMSAVQNMNVLPLQLSALASPSPNYGVTATRCDAHSGTIQRVIVDAADTEPLEGEAVGTVRVE
eukprot:1197127-Alexandrium_andersonii.AAC.1